MMLDDKILCRPLLGGTIGLERETLRVTADGYMAHTPHPFGEDKHIVRDFCENQAEINTGVHASAASVTAELREQTDRLYRELEKRGEYLWMFSNPPYIRGEEDIPIARYEGVQKSKQTYRDYLAGKYGRAKMTLSGIHVNYSFSDDRLQEGFAASGAGDFAEYKNSVYLHLAKTLIQNGWILNLLLSASPLCDGSYRDARALGKDLVTGDASIRCSFHGYWNLFTPVLDYGSLQSYAESIQKYISNGWLYSVSELYYPVRLKPRGSNRLNALVQNGVNHIELRNVDLNPYASEGIDERDLQFIELLILYLSAQESRPLTAQDQYFAIQNFKSAARYDIDREVIRLHQGATASVRDAGLRFLYQMNAFFRRSGHITDDERCYAIAVMDHQVQKLTVPGARYAERVMQDFSGGYVRRALSHIKTGYQLRNQP